MDNIYHQYWQQELMYQLASADRYRKRAYVCSPFRADTREQREKNLRTARAYMFYANKKMNMNAAAPHAYMPLLLCDEIPAERAIALRFGLEILEQSDVMLVCGNRLSNGMRGEIVKAALLRMPITVFDEGLYLEVQKLVTQNNGDKKSVKLDRENFPMAFTEPESYKAETVTEEMVEAMVDEIRVNTDGSLDIRFKYMPEFEEMFKECERIRKEVA